MHDMHTLSSYSPSDFLNDERIIQLHLQLQSTSLFLIRMRMGLEMGNGLRKRWCYWGSWSCPCIIPVPSSSLTFCPQQWINDHCVGLPCIIHRTRSPLTVVTELNNLHILSPISMSCPLFARLHTTCLHSVSFTRWCQCCWAMYEW